MPEIVNFTPFPNFRYYSTDNQNREFGVVIVKATYAFAPSGRLLVAEEQAPMIFTDKCHGAVNVSSLWHPSDLVPNKPNTDILVNGVARAPDGAPSREWGCGIRVEGREHTIEKKLRVTGPRQWVPRWKRPLSAKERNEWHRHRRDFDRWELSQPEPICDLPIHYEYAYGGLLATGEGGRQIIDDRHDNPIGRGWIDAKWTDHTQPQPAPQIELVDDPIIEPYRHYKPQSLGPIPCAWEPRLPLAGTYDAEWQAKVWPNWPADYSFAYHNSAHPDLICRGYLEGDEGIELTGLVAHGREPIRFKLPGERLRADFVRPDGSADRQDMTLDTVFIDVAAANRRQHRLYLSWRSNFMPDQFTHVALHQTAGDGEPRHEDQSMKQSFSKRALA